MNVKYIFHHRTIETEHQGDGKAEFLRPNAVFTAKWCFHGQMKVFTAKTGKVIVEETNVSRLSRPNECFHGYTFAWLGGTTKGNHGYFFFKAKHVFRGQMAIRLLDP